MRSSLDNHRWHPACWAASLKLHEELSAQEASHAMATPAKGEDVEESRVIKQAWLGSSQVMELWNAKGAPEARCAQLRHADDALPHLGRGRHAWSQLRRVS